MDNLIFEYDTKGTRLGFYPNSCWLQIRQTFIMVREPDWGQKWNSTVARPLLHGTVLRLYEKCEQVYTQVLTIQMLWMMCFIPVHWTRMSWISNLAGRAESLLEQVDGVAATALKTNQGQANPSSSEAEPGYSRPPSSSSQGNIPRVSSASDIPGKKYQGSALQPIQSQYYATNK